VESQISPLHFAAMSQIFARHFTAERRDSLLHLAWESQILPLQNTAGSFFQIWFQNRGVLKSKFDSPLYDAAGSQISPLHDAAGSKISPLHYAVESQISPLHFAARSQIFARHFTAERRDSLLHLAWESQILPLQNTAGS
jgi:hypothetical protein